MNYRHAYHAGNFADVLKHVVLARVIDYLKRKPKAFRIIDTHAGIGVYDLASTEAGKTGEWRTGIGRLRGEPVQGEAADLLRPYLDAIASVNEQGRLDRYPGSPAIARHLMRAQDRLTAVELHPDDAALLRDAFAGDYQARVIELDGWLALGAQVPPKEKRGVVIVDPPFEKEGEFDRLADGLTKAHRRWPGGIYLLWYPVKNRKEVERFRDRLRAAGIPRVLDIELVVKHGTGATFDGSGMIVVNPPFTLEDELRLVLPLLRDRLAQDETARFSVEWLAGEAPPS